MRERKKEKRRSKYGRKKDGKRREESRQCVCAAHREEDHGSVRNNGARAWKLTDNWKDCCVLS